MHFIYCIYPFLLDFNTIGPQKKWNLPRRWGDAAEDVMMWLHSAILVSILALNFTADQATGQCSFLYLADF